MNDGQRVFRSLSLAEDLSEPERFGHYRPTSRNTAILRAVASSGATMVVAPYGSGKSLAAGVAALHVRNSDEDRAVLGTILPRLADVEPSLAPDFVERAASEARGAVVVLTGAERDPLASIRTALDLDAAPKAGPGLSLALRERGIDRLAVLWDEFGRHLEALVVEGRSSELDAIQRLAEHAARADEPRISLTLLLHQNLLAYASTLGETSRGEWRKIEGRFAQVRLVEDSREMYRLVGDVVRATRPEGARRRHATVSAVNGAIAARWFDGIEDRRIVADLLRCASPLTAGALQVLPTLVARIGQNERSLFSFLREADLTKTVDVEVVYSAFSDAMRADVGIGGTYKRWVETESARSRAANPTQRLILAAACLLQLGGSGERRRLPRAVLLLAVSEPDDAVADAEIDALVEAKLLLWRRHNDDVVVRHGADVDVALRVREERDRRTAAFDLKAFLEQRFSAPHVRPSGHNARLGVNRHLAGRYVTVDQVLARIEPDDGEQGAVVAYILARSADEVEAVREAVAVEGSRRLVHVVPERPVEVTGPAIEVLALEALRSDPAFCATDPMVTTEIDELLSVAEGQLATALRALLDPRASSASWHSGGRSLPVSADRPASMAASALFDAWFPKTPRISNDQLMRPRASRTTQTARVRVVGAVLERWEQEHLGYDPVDAGAEASIYRTVLEHTGLKRPEPGLFADVDDLGDDGLREVWATVRQFFGEPTEFGEPRSVASLVSDLAAHPFGVPRAVMPLIVAAGYKRFARVASVRRDGKYLPDLLGFQFDQMVMEPQGYAVTVERASVVLTDYLSELCYAFTHRRPRAGQELISSAVDALARWRTTVPEGARRTLRRDGSASGLLRAVSSSAEPDDVVLRLIPQAFGLAGPGPKVIGHVERARKEIDLVQDELAEAALATAASIFRAAPGTPGLIDAVGAWASCFDANAMEARSDLRVSDKSVLRKAVETGNGRFSPKSFVGALSSILVQRSLDRWDDRTADQFRVALRDCRERIEAAALDTVNPRPELRPVVAARLADLQALLTRMDAATDDDESGALRSMGANR